MTILEPVAVQPPMELAHKTYSALMTKLIDEEQGIVEALVSVTGNVDSSNDIIEPGAYSKSLVARKPKVCYGHDWGQPIGKCLEIFELMPGDPRLPEDLKSAGYGALYAKILVARNTRRGADAWEEMKFFHDESQWSIGYAVKDAEYSKDSNANLLKDLDLFELSWVLWGANGATRSLALKVDPAAANEKVLIAGDLDEDTKELIMNAVEGVLDYKGDYSAAERQEMAKSGQALPDGSFPIKNCADVEDAKHRIGTSKHPKSTVVAHINKRAAALGCDKVGETDDNKDDEERLTFAEWEQKAKVKPPKLHKFIPDEKNPKKCAICGLGEDAPAHQAPKAEAPCQCQEKAEEYLDELEVKAGRVLSSAHTNRLKQARDHIDTVLKAADKSDDDEDDKKELDVEVPAADALKTAQEELSKAQERLDSLTAEVLKESHPSKTSDEAWVGSPQWKRLPADETSLKLATAWVDGEGDPGKKSSYRFIHHFVDEKGEVGAASTAACLIGIGALNGKSSVVPDEDKQSVYDHFKAHLEAADYPDIPDLELPEIDELSKEDAAWLAENYGEKPYNVEKRGNEYCVIGGESGSRNFGCHPSRSQAVNHMRALYANTDGKANDPDDAGAGKPPGFSPNRFDPNAGQNPSYDEGSGVLESYTQPDTDEPQVDGTEHNFVPSPNDPEECVLCGGPPTASMHHMNVDANQKDGKDVYSAGPGQMPGGVMSEAEDGKPKLKPHKFVPGGKKPTDDNDEDDMKKSNDPDDSGAGDTCKVCGQPEGHSIHTSDPYGKGAGFTHQLKRVQYYVSYQKDGIDTTVSTLDEVPGLSEVTANTEPDAVIAALEAAVDEAMSDLAEGDVDAAEAVVAEADAVVDVVIPPAPVAEDGAEETDGESDEAEESEETPVFVTLSPKELLDLEIELAELELS